MKLKYTPLLHLYLSIIFLLVIGSALIWMNVIIQSSSNEYLTQLKSGNKSPEYVLSNCGNPEHQNLNTDGYKHYENAVKVYHKRLISNVEFHISTANVLMQIGIAIIFVGAFLFYPITRIKKQHKQLEPIETMSDEMRVKYLFVNLKYSHYIRLQVFCFTSLIVASLVLNILFRDSKCFRYLWVVALAGAVFEIFETALAIRKAKREFINR